MQKCQCALAAGGISPIRNEELGMRNVGGWRRFCVGGGGRREGILPSFWWVWSRGRTLRTLRALRSVGTLGSWGGLVGWFLYEGKMPSLRRGCGRRCGLCEGKMPSPRVALAPVEGDFKGRCSMWVAWGGRCLGSMYQGRLWNGKSFLRVAGRGLWGFLCGGSR